MGAIGSNEPRWLQPVSGKYYVHMQFMRPEEADRAAVESFLEFFTPPSDSPWLR